MTWNTNEGGQFNLTRTNQSLFVYIYNTNIEFNKKKKGNMSNMQAFI